MDTLATYDIQAPFYDDMYGHLGPTSPEVEAYAELVDPGADIIELGAGTGRVLIPLAERLETDRTARAGRIVGVEAAAPMLDVARQKDDGRIEWVSSDATAPDLADRLGPGSFDLVFAACGLLSLLDEDQRTRLFANAARLLTPSGCLVIEAVDPPAIERFVEHAGQIFSPRSANSGLVMFSSITGDRWNTEFVWIADGTATCFSETAWLTPISALDDAAARAGLAVSEESSQRVADKLRLARGEHFVARLYRPAPVAAGT